MHTNPDGTLDLLEIESKVRSREDAHQPISRLICVEQTHNGTGGRVLSLEYLQRVNFLRTLLPLGGPVNGRFQKISIPYHGRL